MLLTRSAIQSQYRQCWITELGRALNQRIRPGDTSADIACPMWVTDLCGSSSCHHRPQVQLIFQRRTQLLISLQSVYLVQPLYQQYGGLGSMRQRWILSEKHSSDIPPCPLRTSKA